LVALFEAISGRGLDNLFIPLGAFVLLKVSLDLTVIELAQRCLVIIGLTGFTWWWRNRSTLSDSGALAAALASYAFWAVGDTTWLVPPAVMLLFYPLLTDRAELRRAHGTRAMLGITGAGLVWVLAAKSLGQPALHCAFVVSFGTQLALTARLHGKPLIVSSGLGSLFALLWLGLWHSELPTPWPWLAAFTVLPIAAATLVFKHVHAQLKADGDSKRWFFQGLAGFTASLPVAALVSPLARIFS
jgi:phytol kinase